MPTARRFVPRLVVSAVLLLALSSPVAAQGTARSLDIDGSAISSGMGGASTAVFWSAEPNTWANPALLGYYHGVRYQRAWSRLVPGLASDVMLESNRITLGACGVGVTAGRTRLDYGESIEVEGGEVVGVFTAYEDIRPQAVGVSLAGLAEALAPNSRLAGLGRNFDLAFGVARKSVKSKLWYSVTEASGPAYDVGLLARAGYDFGGPLQGFLPVRMDAAFGAAVLNANDVTFRYVAEDVPTSRLRHLGGSLRLAVGRPAGWSGLLRGLDPLVSIGGAWDAEHVQAGDDEEPGYDVTHVGAELTLLNVFSARVGHVTDHEGDIEDLAWGVGVGLPIAGVAGIRFDYAEYPQSTSLPHVIRHTASVYADPLALWRMTR